jgi:ATP-dependent Lon protease
MGEMAQREMRRAWMTAFGNAKLARRGEIQLQDSPEGHAKKSAIGFVH